MFYVHHDDHGAKELQVCSQYLSTVARILCEMTLLIPPDVRQTVALFAHQLESGALRQPFDIATQCAKLFRVAALSVWDTDSGDEDAAQVASPLVAVEEIGKKLLTADPASSSIEGVWMWAVRCIRESRNKKEAAASLGGLVSKVSDSRTALVDHAVSVVAGGPVERSVVIIGAPSGGLAELAVAEASADMDVLNVAVVNVSPEGDASALMMAERFKKESAVSKVEVVELSKLYKYLRAVRIHGCLLDGFVVDGTDAAGGDAVGWCGAAAVAATAQLAGIRVFVCAASYNVLAGNTSSFSALQDINGHPGKVVSYNSLKESGAELRAVNPLYDRIPRDLYDVLITSEGPVAPLEAPSVTPQALGDV